MHVHCCSNLNVSSRKHKLELDIKTIALVAIQADNSKNNLGWVCYDHFS